MNINKLVHKLFRHRKNMRFSKSPISIIGLGKESSSSITHLSCAECVKEDIAERGLEQYNLERNYIKYGTEMYPDEVTHV